MERDEITRALDRVRNASFAVIEAEQAKARAEQRPVHQDVLDFHFGIIAGVRRVGTELDSLAGVR